MNEEFLKKIKTYLSNDDYNKFLSSLSNSPKFGFSLNLKKLYQSSIDLDELISKWKLKKIFQNDYYIYFEYDKIELEKNNIFVGKHPLYHTGLYYIQEPSANVVLRNIDIKADYKIFDMCAAPGGKSIQALYNIDKSKGGFLYANDIDKSRYFKLKSNIERMGFLNDCYLFNEKPSYFINDFQNYFDLVILDAPCSGEGMMRKSEEAIEQWSQDLVLGMSKLQRNLFDVAYNLVKKGGIISYSTCTFSKEEDEDNVECFLNKYNDLELVDLNKIYFFDEIGEGQFYAIFKKN